MKTTDERKPLTMDHVNQLRNRINAALLALRERRRPSSNPLIAALERADEAVVSWAGGPDASVPQGDQDAGRKILAHASTLVAQARELCKLGNGTFDYLKVRSLS